MKIFELLSGEPGMSQPDVAPMAGAAMPTMGGQPSPTQTAGLGSTISNFFTTPQPLGGTTPPTPTSSAPPATTPTGQPAQTSGGYRPFGNTGAGSALDQLNTNLGAKPPQ